MSGGGSMVDPGALSSRIQAARADREGGEGAADDASSMLSQAEDSRQQAAESEAEKRIKAELPEKVTRFRADNAIYETPYPMFKKEYASVYAAVEGGDLFMPGYVSVSFELMGRRFKVRSLRRCEQDAFAIANSDATRKAQESDSDKDILAREQNTIGLAQLVCSTLVWSGQEVSEPPLVLSPDTMEKWFSLDGIKARIAEWGSLADAVVSTILMKWNELNLAVRYATIESLKNL